MLDDLDLETKCHDAQPAARIYLVSTALPMPSLVEKSEPSGADEFMKLVDNECQRSGASRTTAMHQVRKAQPDAFAHFQGI